MVLRANCRLSLSGKFIPIGHFIGCVEEAFLHPDLERGGEVFRRGDEGGVIRNQQ